ncbi:hypothetical protein Tco_1113879 [Tanacetum coccineum]|uniref:KIB1-4 beta-propeller domain-containing protein n=1 Tax=Tanacetum coccineum TaxID=301880 RepID=A0ABQ5ITX7_9ASTR
MEQQHTLYNTTCDQLLPLSAKYPWFVAENLGDEEDGSTDHIFYTLYDPLSKYQCQIPEFRGRRIRGYYYGWVILSNHPQNVTWSLWNPITSKTINFPSLILKDGDLESIGQCCLSAPPDDPSSILLLMRINKPSFVFFRLVSKRKKLRWIEMSYASQLKRITGEDGLMIYSVACCNGKVYALNYDGSFDTYFIQLDIEVKEREVLIKLLLLGMAPSPNFSSCPQVRYFLKGSCTELFFIRVGFKEGTITQVCVYKLDMSIMKSGQMETYKDLDMSNKRWEEVDIDDIITNQEMWEELVDLKDAIFYAFTSAANKQCVTMGMQVFFISFVFVYCLKNIFTNHILCRLEDDHGISTCTVDSKRKDDEIVVRSPTVYEAEFNESWLLSLPFDNLEMIMGLCVGVEYINFRATCKHCHLAVPSINWSDESASKRMQTYSLISPWLMVLDEDQGKITFTDPLLGDTYFMKNLHVSSLTNQVICCSRFGWLLFRSNHFHCLVFVNPFTGDLRKLPKSERFIRGVGFSAPPNSPDCMVVGYSKEDIHIHFVAREQSWRRLGVGPYSIRFPTFIGRDLYALRDKGELIGFKDLAEDDSSRTVVEVKFPTSCSKSVDHYLMSCGQHLLLVMVSKFGEHIEVFKKIDSKQEWEKIDSLGKHMIYICGPTCLCVEAKTPKMENKIYFPLLHFKNRKIVFYSLETCMYHTFNSENIQPDLKDFFGTTYHLFPQAWIEPSWY